MGFKVKLKNMRQLSENIRDIQKQLDNYQEELIAINNALRWQIKCRDQISNRISQAARRVEEQTNTLSIMSSSLEEIIALYDATEKRITGEAAEGKNLEEAAEGLSEEAKSFLENVDWTNVDPQELLKNLLLILGGRFDLVLLNQLIQYFYKKAIQKNAEIVNWISSFEDETTREYLEEYRKYTETIKNTYDNSSGTARDLYDKYKDKIKIASMDEKGSYHSNGKLYIDYEGNIKDPRGADSVYYHESGHWIVNEEKWVHYDQNGNPQMSPEFEKFDQAVKTDVSNYISQIEAEQRAKYSEKYSGQQLEQIVKQETTKYLENELGGSNYHSLDGVSDMIDAASNGKYRITYGHSPDDNGIQYWEKNSTRQANEAFAEMFSADFCNDTTESDFMREHFPNAYKEYESLKESAIAE